MLFVWCLPGAPWGPTPPGAASRVLGAVVDCPRWRRCRAGAGGAEPLGFYSSAFKAQELTVRPPDCSGRPLTAPPLGPRRTSVRSKIRGRWCGPCGSTAPPRMMPSGSRRSKDGRLAPGTCMSERMGPPPEPDPGESRPADWHKESLGWEGRPGATWRPGQTQGRRRPLGALHLPGGSRGRTREAGGQNPRLSGLRRATRTPRPRPHRALRSGAEPRRAARQLARSSPP